MYKHENSRIMPSAGRRMGKRMDRQRQSGSHIVQRILALLMALALILSMYLTLRAQIRFSGLNYVGQVAEYAAQVTAADALAQSIGEKVASAEDARRIFSQAVHLAGKIEGVFVLPLDAGRRTLSAPILVSLGSESTAVVQPKDIFAEALKVGAEAVVIAHNHPSGDLMPSVQDRVLTDEVSPLGDSLGIKLVDHLVLM